MSVSLTRHQFAAHVGCAVEWLDFLIEERAIVEPLTLERADSLKRRREDVEKRASAL